MTTRTVDEHELREMIGRGEINCQWYAACPNAADRLESHPVLVLVPTCERCAAVIEALS